MKGVLLIIVLTFVFLLHAAADIPIQADFDIQQIAGKWYPSAVALKNAEAFPSHQVSQIGVPSENGDLLFKNTYMIESKCNTREVNFFHTDEPGKFLSSERTSTLRMVDVNSDSYYILHAEMPYSEALNLYTRKQIGLAQEKKKFVEVAKSLGFQDYQIKFMNKGVATTRIVETDYSSYCIMHVSVGDTNILHLYSRELQVSDDVREKYINYVSSLQFIQEDIRYETRTGKCAE